ncbi:hypothetical protein [Phycicoccus sp.]|uniref:hypothetical protein n=1 Tax=Phycicoccus sp. TaxID=1902410 RepID=UPI002C8FD372|nr:hypothetical protein [Phycicoccus sp.]HMM97233.1 hypothetical protein [Phycicoccus sp.]
MTTTQPVRGGLVATLAGPLERRAQAGPTSAATQIEALLGGTPTYVDDAQELRMGRMAAAAGILAVAVGLAAGLVALAGLSPAAGAVLRGGLGLGVVLVAFGFLAMRSTTAPAFSVGPLGVVLGSLEGGAFVTEVVPWGEVAAVVVLGPTGPGQTGGRLGVRLTMPRGTSSSPYLLRDTRQLRPGEQLAVREAVARVSPATPVELRPGTPT